VKPMKNASSVYLRFVELSRAGEGATLPCLSPDEGRLFEHIALAQYRGENLAVRAVMALRQLGAPATIHTRLKALRANGWIMLADTDDVRRKHVIPTPAARRHLAWLARCVVRATTKSA
jgi:hypothetical protein